MDFNDDFEKNRGGDPNYKLAQLIRSSIRDAEKYNLDNNKYTGWGIFNAMDHNMDADYIYVLKLDGDVTFRSTDKDKDGE